MDISTTFWTSEVHSFDELLYINGHTKDIIFRGSMAQPFLAIGFFKNIARFLKSRRFWDEQQSFQRGETKNRYQFAVMKDGAVMPIVWFELRISETMIISHDSAFHTTLLRKNGHVVPMGRFPMSIRKKIPVFREHSMRALACKYMANRIHDHLALHA